MTPARPSLPLAVAVLAAFRIGIDMRTIAMAYGLSVLRVEEILRALGKGRKR